MARKKSSWEVKVLKGTACLTVVFAAAAFTNARWAEHKSKRENKKLEEVVENETPMDVQQTAFPASYFSVSDKTINSLKKHEKFSSRAYKDGFDAFGKQLYSIGYGHQIQKGESFPNKISKQEALELFKKDLVLRENTVKQEVKVPITQEHFDSVVSFVYNLGETNFRKSDLLKLLNQGEYDKASEEFVKWGNHRKLVDGELTLVRHSGLTKRREEERDMFKRGTFMLKLPIYAVGGDEDMVAPKAQADTNPAKPSV